MIHSKSERLKKIVIITDDKNDKRLFYTEVNLVQEDVDEQLENRRKELLKNPSTKALNHKKDASIEYKIGNYLIQQTLGEGTFGKVKLGIYLPNNEKVAIKVLEKDRMTDKDDQIRVKREFDMLSKFNHPNVILVTEIFESLDSYYSVMEFCEGGELFNYIVEKKRLSEKETSFYYFQIINGLEYIHSLGIVHRDLKPENLLLTKDHLLKIIDFGLSNYFRENETDLLSTPCGSPCYASPEMVSGKKYDGVKIDIWATGIILFAMLCGYLPFEDKINDILFDKILECKIEFPDYLSDEAKDLISKILVVDPEKRITIPQIKKHSFFLKGKKLFEQVFTIRPVYYNIENATISSEKKENNNYNNENNKLDDKKEKKEKKEIEQVEDIERENKTDISENINNLLVNNELKDENELLENKENINIENIKINENYIENINNNQITEIEIENENNNNLKNNEKGLISNKNSKSSKIEKAGEIRNTNTNNNQKKNKRPKELNNKYFQYLEKKGNHQKINITDNIPNNININNNIFYEQNYKNKNPKNKKQLSPEKDNKKIIQFKEKKKIQNNLVLEPMTKERNTIGSIGSSLVENFNNISQQTNITNFLVNNINYNVNISFDHIKRNYSQENTKDNSQKEQITKHNINNTFSINTVIKNSNNTNNINIIENNINSKNNNEINNNYLFNHFNYNNKISKNLKIRRKNNPNRIKRNLKVVKGSKHYNNSDNIRRPRQETDFNICKLMNELSIKKNYKEFLSKQYENNNCMNNIYKSKTKEKKSYNNRTNQIPFNKNISNNKESNNISTNENKKNYPRKLKIQKNENINSKSTINKNISKIKYKKLMVKSSNTINKSIINNKKKVNKLQYNNLFNHNSLEDESNPISMKTEPNIKYNCAKAINKLTKKKNSKNIENKKLNHNTKQSVITNKKTIKETIDSPLKKRKIRQKLIKFNQINQLFNSSNKKHFETINNAVTNYKLYKPELISISSNTNKNPEKNITNIKPNNLDINNKKEDIQNKILEKASKSLEIKNKKETSYKPDKKKINHIESNNNKNENQKNNISCMSNFNNISNNEISFNYIKIEDKTPFRSKSKSKTKNLSRKKRNEKKKNEILIIYSERNTDYEKNKIIKMNKYRNICARNIEDQKDSKSKIDNKKAHIKTIKRIPNINNYKYKMINFQKNKTHNNFNNNIKHLISFSSRIQKKNFDINKNHLKFNSMKLTDIYKNNIRNKNKVKKVYLLNKKKSSNTNIIANNHEMEKNYLNSKGMPKNQALNHKNIISIKNIESKKAKEDKKNDNVFLNKNI